ncbi:hypothetical protein DICVIV_04170 [Dictyocaulus viviparus]|uniref:Saposin B-type domain-containing protein n=1 Tax=Dictyocaulus viviparus TaxID=29172 RepID=A0A0D8XYI5_DICVI|nr:hypothetical protein DICVIV_04170 [Dictyocaulus viviparus]
MHWLFIGLVPLAVLISATSMLSLQEKCELCQMALRTVFSHFGAKVPSRRKLLHQLKHECRRHFNYRRRCLPLMKQNCDVIFHGMANNSFRPIEVCLILKECKEHDSSISVEFVDFYKEATAFPLVGFTDDIYNPFD